MSEPSKQLRIRDAGLDLMADKNALNVDLVTRESIAFPSVLDCDPTESDPYMPRVNKTTAAFISETQSPDKKDTVARGQRYYTAGATSGPTQPSRIPSTQRATPAGLLERSKSFLPARYTLQNGVPSLFGYHHRELQATEYTRVSQFAILFVQDPNKWTRLTISITVTMESRYWHVDKVNTTELIPKRVYQLPDRVTSRVIQFLRSHSTLPHDVHLSILFGSQAECETIGKRSASTARLTKPLFDVTAYLRVITRQVKHFCCPWFYERQLDQRPLYTCPTNLFIAFFDSRWVMEHRFGSSQVHIDADFYMLKVLHCLEGAPRINPFVGVVLDDDTGIITAFLCEFPAKGELFYLLKQTEISGQPTNWGRRVKWCQQIVQAVAKVHSKGFVVGSLAESPQCPFGVDGLDNAVLCRRIRKSFVYRESKTGVLPPECRNQAYSGAYIEATAETDIYQLGLQLWHIAAGQNSGSCTMFCHLAGCISAAGEPCTDSHADPIQLPSPAADAPPYLLEVIAACRAENPHKRTPASELLRMFPILDEDNEAQGQSSWLSVEESVNHSSPGEYPNCLSSQKENAPRNVTAGKALFDGSSQRIHLTTPEECADKFAHRVNCDICGLRTTQHYFHCPLCDSGDFDLCPSCFHNQVHCPEPDHYLHEFRNRQFLHCYSSPKQDGRREAVTLG
jgi:hypothetical protein